MKLFIVESPNKIKKLQTILGGDYKIMASVGHIRDLPVKGGIGIDFADTGIEEQYAIAADKKKVVADLRRAARAADAIYLATDPDREGEAIAWHLKEVLGPHTYYRVRYQSISKAEVLGAIRTAGTIDMNRVAAQRARRVVDRVVGWSVSPTCKKGTGDPKARSAGRCQSVALRILAEREHSIATFKPETYFTINGTFRVADKDPIFVSKLVEWDGKKLKDEHTLRTNEAVVPIVKAIKAASFSVASVRHKEAVVKAPAPYTTSSVQQDCSARHKMRPAKTMKVLQALFEKGLITYHRTDSTALSPEAVTAARDVVLKTYGSTYLPEQPPVYKAKADAQEAHEAIRPTQIANGLEIDLASADEQKVYALIWQRTLASQMLPGKDTRTAVDIAICDPQTHKRLGTFYAKGRVQVFDGFRRIYVDYEYAEKKKQRADEADEVALPVMADGDPADLKLLASKEGKTKPPPRFTEAQLIKRLEKDGIGRPSTYAAILETLLRREYVQVAKLRFHVTDTGMRLHQYLLKKYKDNFIEIKYTAKVEAVFDRIAAGKTQWIDATNALCRSVVDLAKSAGLTYDPLTDAEPERSGHEPCPDAPPCPSCGGAMRLVVSKKGPFYSCCSYPTCTGTAPVLSKDVMCPKCGRPMVKRKNDRGIFYTCSQPRDVCDGLRDEQRREVTRATDHVPQADPAAEPCPVCGGPMRRVTYKGGEFFACMKGRDVCNGTRNIDNSTGKSTSKKKSNRRKRDTN